MTLRERIADWLTGGLYSHYHWHSLRLKWFSDRLTEAEERLDRIAAQETPGANATVQRMARIARGEE